MQADGDVGVLGGVIQRLVQRHQVEGHTRLAGAGDVGIFDRVQVEENAGQFVHAVAVQPAVEHVGQQHGVVDGRNLDVVAGQHLHVVFDVLADLQHRGILQQRLQKLDRLFHRHLVRHLATTFAGAGAGTITVQVERPLRRRLFVGQRDVARAAGFDGQRHPHQLGPHGVERRGFRIDGQDAGARGLPDPGFQRTNRLHQLVAGFLGRRFSFWFRRLPGFGPAAETGLGRSHHRLEALFLEERQQRVPLRLPDGEGTQFLGHRHVIAKGHQPAGNPRQVGLVDEVFAAFRLFDFPGPFEERLQIAVFVDQLRRRLDADAGNAGNVVGRIAGQGLHLDHLFGPDAEFFHHLVGADDLVLHGVHHDHPGADQLHHVLVARHDGDVGAGLDGQPGIGGDQVVGLEAVHVDTGDVQGPGGVTHQLELRDQVFRRRRTVGLVVGVDIVAEGLARTIEDDGDMVGVGVLDHFHQHPGEAIDGVDRGAVRPGHGCLDAVVGAENEARAVDQEYVFGLFAHLVTATPDKNFFCAVLNITRLGTGVEGPPEGIYRSSPGRPLAVPRAFSGRRPVVARSS